MDETYIKVADQWKYLYRTVDKTGATVDFLLRAKRDRAAARAFFERPIGLHDLPEKVAIDKSGSNKAAIVNIQADTGLAIALRQSKYLNNIVEQYRRAIKRVTGYVPHARIQKFPRCRNPHRRHRNHAVDSQKPTG